MFDLAFLKDICPVPWHSCVAFVETLSTCGVVSQAVAANNETTSHLTTGTRLSEEVVSVTFKKIVEQETSVIGELSKRFGQLGW